jgi:hypothetical protein
MQEVLYTTLGSLFFLYVIIVIDSGKLQSMVYTTYSVKEIAVSFDNLITNFK